MTEYFKDATALFIKLFAHLGNRLSTREYVKKKPARLKDDYFNSY